MRPTTQPSISSACNFIAVKNEIFWVGYFQSVEEFTTGCVLPELYVRGQALKKLFYFHQRRDKYVLK
jgi:hypothetical protein